MNQRRRRFLVASALAPPAGADGSFQVRAVPVFGDSAGADSNMRRSGIEQREGIKGLGLAAGNAGWIMAAATLQRQVLALEGLASPHFLPALP